MENLTRDLRYGIRMLFKSPGFTIVAVLSLALAIGANTTIFTIVNAVFLRPLPVEDISSLVQMYTIDQSNDIANFNFSPTSYVNYKDYRDQNEVLSGLVSVVDTGLTLTGRGDPRNFPGQLVSGDYFEVLGVDAVLGRTFLAEEDLTPGTHPVAVVSHSLWVREFGSDPSLVGDTLNLSGTAYTVIGVGPPGFKGINTLSGPDRIWIPTSMYEQVLTGTILDWMEARRALFVTVFGRLKPGVGIGEAEAAMKTIGSRLEEQFRADNADRTVALVPLTRSAIGMNQRDQMTIAGSLMMGVVALVLLIACVNLANLLLARAAQRGREVGIRTALGAARTRLIRQLLTESLVLAAVGGVSGLIVAFWARDLLWSFRPPFLNEDAVDLTLDPGVLLFTIGVSILTGILFGVIPAWKMSDPDLNEVLKQGGRQGAGGIGGGRIRGVLVVSQVALALVALIGAGLFVRSMQEAQSIDPGFESEKLFVVGMNLGSQQMGADQGLPFYREVRERTESIPGVAGAAIVSNFPMGGGFMRSVFLEGQEQVPGQRDILTMTNIVTPGYFETLGIPLLRGRAFNDFDREGAVLAAVISEATVEKFWPETDPIGEHFIFFGQEEYRQIVGIVADSTILRIGEDPTAVIYLPMDQNYVPFATLQVRTEAEPEAVMGTVREEVQALDRNLPLTNINTIGQIFDQGLFAPRMGAALLSLFGFLALALAAIGIYGVMAYSVSQRTHEIGIRMALGAAKGDVVNMIVRQGVTLTMIGLGIGLGTAFLVTRLVASLLFGVSATDPLTFAGVAVILGAVGTLACYLPARRATQVDPLDALRIE